MSFQATEFEFRARLWFILASYTAGFLLYSIDHVNASAALTLLVLGHPSANSAEFNRTITYFFAFGTLLVTACAIVRTWAGAYLHSSVIHDSALHGENLVADGPYRYIRNPLYFGNVLLALGIGLLASRLGFLVIVVGNWLIVYRLILREETTLLQSQGESYRRYLAAVPRLLPSLTPRVPSSGAKPNWRDAFTGEFMMWSCAAAMAAFTVTKNLKWFWIAFGTGMAVYFLQAALRKRSKPEA
jgi:protein-S-isoprenylcysteine O-methyltransferase Ste14